MSLTAPSDATIDEMLRGGLLVSGKLRVGPLGLNAIRLLRLLWKSRDDLARMKGAEQATALRREYLEDAASKNSPPPGPLPPSGSKGPSTVPANGGGAPSATSKIRWRLHRVRCQSIRGIAPIATFFEFLFDGVPVLLYGGNGSGKSSLLNAVIWVLTGRVVTDSEDEADEISLYAARKAGARAVKLCDWPVVHTLPDGSDSLPDAPDCWAELLLWSENNAQKLFLRRSLRGKLEESDDGAVWRECLSLARHGITPLDIQLSVSAATAFGRRSIENSTETRHLLSMMLGYDALEALGDLVTTLATNLTKAAKTEREAIALRQERLRAKLAALPARLRDGLPLRVAVDSLVGDELPSAARIEDVHQLAAREVQTVETELAGLVGLKAESASPPAGLADALTLAVGTLDKPVNESFPTLTALQPERILQPATTTPIAERLEAAGRSLNDFEEKATAKVRERFAWWQKESAKGSKVSLLIQVAAYYNPDDHRCPVCEQSIRELAIASELLQLKGAAAHLRVSLRDFFRDLADMLKAAVSPLVLDLAGNEPAARFHGDWTRLKGGLGHALAPVISRYEPAVLALFEDLPATKVAESNVVPVEADVGFREAAADLLKLLRAARRGLAICAWSIAHLQDLAHRLGDCLTRSQDEEQPSLLAVLARGKNAAADGLPLVNVRDSLAEAAAEGTAIELAGIGTAALDELRTALDEVKPLGKYAIAEVERIFEQIEDKTIENFGKLYPHANPRLAPSRLHLNKGRDKSVEAYLAGNGFEVPGRHFGNAGLQRAMALAFYFALLERHPGGLGFVLMDDPILSLDDDHREAWSANILQPALAFTQVIVATHQKQFLNNCRMDFRPGRLVELNPRRRSQQITTRPGDRLAWAAELLLTAWGSVATEMRKYREDLLITLDAYSPTAFFNRANLAHSLDQYVGFSLPHPLVGSNRDKIVRRLRDEKVSRVLDPGSHAMTEADVTEPMVVKCLEHLRELDLTFRNELDRLDELLRRERRCKSLTAAVTLSSPPAPTTGPAITPIDPLRIDGVAWPDPVKLRILGTAAAQTRGCVVDMAEMPWEASFPPGGAVHVAGDGFCPIARAGQWALLAAEGEEITSGDLVAALDRSKNNYLRRAWSVGDAWILEAVNPSASVPPVSVRKCECIVRKVRGICYGPRKEPRPGNGRYILEWAPRQDFSADSIAECYGVSITGTSLEPIAYDGQIVLVREKIAKFDAVRSGSLAVVETEDDGVGIVIKRIFPQGRSWLLVSPNLMEPRDPISVLRSKIRAVWPVGGVLFAVTT